MFGREDAAIEFIGVGLRAVAAIIDTALLFIVGYLIALATGGVTEEGFLLQGVPFFIRLAIALGYYIVMEARSGAALGKRVMKLKVVKLPTAGWPAGDYRVELFINGKPPAPSASA